ncbi:response regulator [Limnoglobus roseus]|uniref:hypothetical protein n=1 Tax=Limnoglobus roseus TaxID=2598579 RepID=UPI0011EB9DF0|nr:hypothetical protein [Limnoglobus roseus]
MPAPHPGLACGHHPRSGRTGQGRVPSGIAKGAESRLRIEAAGFHQHLVKPAAVEQIVGAMNKPGA